MANLDEQGILYGNTDEGHSLQRDHVTLEEKHQRLYHDLFSASVSLAYGKDGRIDTDKFRHQYIEPTLEGALHRALRPILAIPMRRRVPGAKKGVASIDNRGATAALLQQGAQEMIDGVMTGASTMLDNLPSAVERMKAIKAEVDKVVPAFQQELAEDPAKQFAMVKILASGLPSTAEARFTDPRLTLATFVGIANDDIKTGISGELIAGLREGRFDEPIAAEVLTDVVDKVFEGDPLSQEDTELYRLLQGAQYYSGDDIQNVIAAFSRHESLKLWSPKCLAMHKARQEQYARTLSANHNRVDDLIYENYLGTIPLTEAGFTQAATNIISENIHALNVSGSNIVRSNRLRQHAEEEQRQKRERLVHRMTGTPTSRAILGEVQRERRFVGYLQPNGENDYHVSDEPGTTLRDYLSGYGGDLRLEFDLTASIGYLGELTPKEMAVALSHGNGLRTLPGHSIKIDGKSHPLIIMKPKRVPGLRTQSPNTEKMRILFVQLKQGGLGILDVVRRDRLERFQSTHR